ncbi:hypothetical protein D3C78_674240 [compost metagenome]
MGVIVGRAKQLAARNIFVDRRDSALQAHLCGVNWLANRQFCQRRAIGAQQENGFDVIAAGLFQRQCCQFAVGNAAFGHHAVNGEIELLFYLGDVQLWQLFIAASSGFLQRMGGGYRLLAPFDGDVHQHTSTCVVRGIASRRSPQVRIKSMPSGNGCGRSVSS